ncbi:MAG: hypothetical protein GY853_01075 [PVC group bacterium]|nr:hypothetical protein [PVC group bacterium]
MGSTIVSSGERIACDDTKHVFVHGAYNLGPVLEVRNLSTTAAHPGEHVDHVQTTGGEDYYIIGPDKTPYSYGILEIDFLLIDDCSDDYTHTTMEVPAIPYHMNPGAYLRNIVCVDPVSSDVSPDEPLSTDSGTAGAFIAYHTETTMVDSDGADGEAYGAGVVISDKEAAAKNRTFLKQAYFKTDPSAAYDTVAYIAVN